MTEELLEILRTNANRHGLAMATETKLVDALRCKPAELAVAVQALVDRKAIRVLSPLPYLVAKLDPSWAGSGEGSASPSGESAPPYSSSHSMNILKDSNREPPADDDLIAEILATLGETNPDPFRKAIEFYAPHVIRKALDRVRKAQTIQKSRTALFRYLLPRLARETLDKR